MTANEKSNTLDGGDNVTPTAPVLAATGSAMTVGTPTGTPSCKLLTIAGLTGQGLSITSTTATDVQTYSFVQSTGQLSLIALMAVEINSGRRSVGNPHVFQRFRNATANVLKAQATLAGAIAVVNGSGGGIFTFAPGGTQALANGWYWVSLWAKSDGATAANGQVTGKLYRASDAVLLDTQTKVGNAGTPVDLGIAAFTTMSIGKPEGSATLPNSFFVDAPKFDVSPTFTASDMYVPAPLNAAPTITSVTADKTTVDPLEPYTLTAVDADADANIVSRTWSLASVTVGTGLTLSDVGPLTLNGGTLLYTYTVTDAGGLSASQDITITYRPADVQVFDGTNMRSAVADVFTG